MLDRFSDLILVAIFASFIIWLALKPHDAVANQITYCNSNGGQTVCQSYDQGDYE